MNGKRSNGHRKSEDELKINSFNNFMHRQSVEILSKRSEAERIQKSQRNSMFDISELRNRPDILKRLLDVAIQIEKEKITSYTYEFNFNITYHTLYGERVVITGEPDFLGNWDPLKGLELEWSPGDVWKVNILIAEGIIKDFEYKYVCVKSNCLIWEAGVNRTFKMDDGVKQNSNISFKKEDCWQTC
ncbi:hypothetical protein SteCoe_22141 [Stentor coeruleus]|uniref:CBM20 domain-containing protein n=1 Tax=Stentor coeruleus TaxID=5963 RepID=A0A1R2BMT2_9CILI|nr:hypothetical protein SteCoe_22141 [Stentor coeruleus]